MDIHVSIAAETLFSIGPLNVTNSFLTMLMVMAVILLLGTWIARRATLQPRGYGQFIFESFVDFMLGIVENTAGRRVGRRIWPLIGGLFVFIILSNYSGLLPGVGTIGVKHIEEEETAQIAYVAQPNTQGPAFAQEEEQGGAHEVLVPALSFSQRRPQHDACNGDPGDLYCPGGRHHGAWHRRPDQAYG